MADLGREVLGAGYVVDIEADGAGLAERLALIPGVSGVEQTGIGKLRLHADRDVRPEAAVEVVAMQGRLKYLGVQEPSLDAIYTRYFEAKPDETKTRRRGPAMQREGSAFQGLGVVMLKELADHLTSVRMRVLERLVVLVAHGRALRRHSADQGDGGRGSVPVPAAVHDFARSAAVVSFPS